ncbi:MAG TPA: TraR/DksA C4-type zinc finger protein [Flavipsychrobacter sp.]|nr:TraR/DksA C4-type zinc finger protein [Flavipsychrobacter sp.]
MNKKSVATPATPEKKTQIPAKKAAAPVAPAKKQVAPEVKPEPAKKATPAPTPAPAAKAGRKAKAPKQKIIVAPTTRANAKPIVPSNVPSPAARPAITRSAIREEKKANVIIAHRRLENKSKQADESKTMINYQPDFTRSILDQPTENQGPVYRYSDEELNEFRELISNRIDAAKKELSYLQGLITRKDEAGTEDTENRYMNMEDGSGAMEREQLAQLASRQIQFINHLEKALMRIENKTYGICRVTGKLIDKARLRAVPHATLSIEAKKTMTK